MSLQKISTVPAWLAWRLRALFGMSRAAECGQGRALAYDYDAETDTLTAWFAPERPAENVEVEPDVFVRVLQNTDEVIGIEVIGCAARFHKAPSAINATFSCELLKKYAVPALEKLGRDCSQLTLSLTAR